MTQMLRAFYALFIEAFYKHGIGVHIMDQKRSIAFVLALCIWTSHPY
jgi:hypothetical protein